MLLVLAAVALVAPASQARVAGGTPVALVTAETLNQLIAVELPSGRVLRRLPMPADPENVDGAGDRAIVVSARAGAVTILDVPRLRIRKVLHGFGSPHIAALAPDLVHAYVTDDARGQFVVVDLRKQRVVRKLFVGYGAHHIAVSGDGNFAWIALGERAHSIAVVDVSDATHPKLVGHVDPHGLAHDLAFSPSGRTVWVTYDDRAQIGVFDAGSGRLLHVLPAGSPPQHVAFGGFSKAPYAYVTSGRDGTLRVVSLRTGRTLRVVRMPRGSFNVTTFGSFVISSSLTNGIVTELTDTGRILLRKRLAPATRDVAIDVM